MPRNFLQKFISNESKEETAIRQQLSLEKFKADINLQNIRFLKHLDRFKTLDVNTHFTMNYNYGTCNSLTPLWVNDC